MGINSLHFLPLEGEDQGGGEIGRQKE